MHCPSSFLCEGALWNIICKKSFDSRAYYFYFILFIYFLLLFFPSHKKLHMTPLKKLNMLSILKNHFHNMAYFPPISISKLSANCICLSRLLSSQT